MPFTSIIRGIRRSAFMVGGTRIRPKLDKETAKPSRNLRRLLIRGNAEMIAEGEKAGIKTHWRIHPLYSPIFPGSRNFLGNLTLKALIGLNSPVRRSRFMTEKPARAQFSGGTD